MYAYGEQSEHYAGCYAPRIMRRKVFGSEVGRWLGMCNGLADEGRGPKARTVDELGHYALLTTRPLHLQSTIFSRKTPKYAPDIRKWGEIDAH